MANGAVPPSDAAFPGMSKVAQKRVTSAGVTTALAVCVRPINAWSALASG